MYAIFSWSGGRITAERMKSTGLVLKCVKKCSVMCSKTDLFYGEIPSKILILRWEL
jgi:hypothetical protein